MSEYSIIDRAGDALDAYRASCGLDRDALDRCRSLRRAMLTIMREEGEAEDFAYREARWFGAGGDCDRLIAQGAERSRSRRMYAAFKASGLTEAQYAGYLNYCCKLEAAHLDQYDMPYATVEIWQFNDATESAEWRE